MPGYSPRGYNPAMNHMIEEHVRQCTIEDSLRLEGQAVAFVKMGYNPDELTILVRKTSEGTTSEVVPKSIIDAPPASQQ
jgi:hypothetical protein